MAEQVSDDILGEHSSIQCGRHLHIWKMRGILQDGNRLLEQSTEPTPTYQIRKGTNILVCFMYASYARPKKRMHSASSALAVATSNKVAVSAISVLNQVGILKNIPHTKNSREL